MDKKEKKNVISRSIDLANGRYKDEEVDTLFDMVTNPSEYDGRTKTISNSYTGWCSDGKYSRKEQKEYTLKSDNDGLRIEERSSYHDDDGQEDSYEKQYDTGRDFLTVFKSIFGN